MRYRHWGKEIEDPSGIVLVKGVREIEEKLKETTSSIGFTVFEYTGTETKVDLIDMGLFTESSYREAVFETSIKMILRGAERRTDGTWLIEDEHSVWLYREWDWRFPFGGFSKAALSSLQKSP